MHSEYELLDSGHGRKLERFGDAVLSRPCEQAIWRKQRPELWESATASFDRGIGWSPASGADLPAPWVAHINGLVMRLQLTPAGHVGVFPETRELWGWITETLQSASTEAPNVLNLFAYSGGATLAAARAGANVCHVDSSRTMVTRARENATLNQLEAAPIRWIVEDVTKYLDREIRRGHHYDAIILDPPSFGRGAKGEQYKLDKDLGDTLTRCSALLAREPLFILLTSHTQGMTAALLEDALDTAFGGGSVASGTMQLTGGDGVRAVDNGVWTSWSPEDD